MKQLAIDTPYTFFENKNPKFVGKNLAKKWTDKLNILYVTPKD